MSVIGVILSILAAGLALLLARETIAWGATADVLRPENLLAARRMVEAFDREAHECARVA